MLASCSADRTVRLYTYNQTPEGPGIKFSHVTTIATGHTKTTRALAWSPSGTSLAVASFDSNVSVWERDTDEDGSLSTEWECAATLEGHETECKSVGYSSSGTFLASCSRDKTVWLWESTLRL